MNEVPPGWYPDPYGAPDLLRWWDGGQWTAETTPGAPEPATEASWGEQPATTEFGTGTGAEGGTAAPAQYDGQWPGQDDHGNHPDLPDQPAGWPGADQHPQSAGWPGGWPGPDQQPGGQGGQPGGQWFGQEFGQDQGPAGHWPGQQQTPGGWPGQSDQPGGWPGPGQDQQPGGQWPGQDQAPGGALPHNEPATESLDTGSAWPGQDQRSGGQQSGGQQAGGRHAGGPWPGEDQQPGGQWPGQDQPGGLGSGAPAVPTPWDQPAPSPPGVEWEPQAEPPPFDAAGPPGTDWQPPAGITPWSDEHDTQQQSWAAPTSHDSPAEPSAGATPWSGEHDTQQQPWAAPTSHDAATETVDPHPTAEAGAGDWTDQQEQQQEQQALDQAGAVVPTFHWADPQEQQQQQAPAPAATYEPPQPQWQPPTPSTEQYENYGQEPKRRGKGLLVGGIAGGLALVLILGVFGGWLFVNRDDDPVTKPSNSATPSSEPSGSPSSTAPTGPRVSVGGVSYTQLDGAWAEPADTVIKELSPNKGQTQVTQKDAPKTRGDWVAQVCVGTLADTIEYSGPDDLESATATFANSVQDKYYSPLETRRENVKKKEIEVSGKRGYEMRFHLAFVDPPDGFATKGETVYVAVVDNDPKPAGVFITVPDNKPELKPTIDDVVAGLQVGS